MAAQTRITDFFIAVPPAENKIDEVIDGNQHLTHRSEKYWTLSCLNILQLNAQSLSPEKIEILQQITEQNDISILCISELGHRRKIDGWQCIVANDCFTQSGIFVRRGASATAISHKSLSFPARVACEGIKVELENHQHILLIHLYIPPDTLADQRKQVWHKLNEFERLHSQTPILIVGDLNTRSTVFDPNEDPAYNPYMPGIIEYSPWEVASTGAPTRENHCLDVALSNAAMWNHLINWQPLNEDISDHLPCITSTDFQLWVPKRESKRVPFIRIDKPATAEAFSDILAENQAPITLEFLHNAMQSSLRYKRSWVAVESYWNDELSILKRKRNRLMKVKHVSPALKQQFYKAQNAFRRAFKKAKLAHLREVVKNASADPTTDLWKIVKTLEPSL
jgi:hypothetical protein